MAFHGAFEISTQTTHQKFHTPFYLTFEKKKDYLSCAKCPGKKPNWTILSVVASEACSLTGITWLRWAAHGLWWWRSASATSQAVQTAEEAKNLAIPSSAPVLPSRDHPLSLHRCVHLSHSDRRSMTLILNSFLFPAKVSIVTPFHSLPKHKCFRPTPRPWLLSDIFTDFKTLARKYIARLHPPGNFWRHLCLCKIAHGWNSLQKLLC